jgi:branched-chain amino acid transport system permease protein
MTVVSFILLYGVSYGLVLCLIAVGLVVTMGLMRVVNLAHGAFAAIGGYLSTGLMVGAGLPLPLAIVVAVIAVGLFSLVVERLIFAHLYGASELDQVLLTIGLNFLAIGGLTLAFGPNVYPTRLPSWLASSVDFGFRAFEVYRLVVIVVGLVVMATLFIVFERTTVGAQLRASVDNRSMAQASGINVPRLFSLTFVAGSGLAALGGAIGAPMLPLEPTYPFKYLVLVLIIVSLSGFGRIRDALGVSILIGVVETAARYFLPAASGFVIYALLIVLIVWRRDGLFARGSAS